MCEIATTSKKTTAWIAPHFRHYKKIRVRRWQKSCTGLPLTSQYPFTPCLILIGCTAGICYGEDHEVVQDFGNGTNPKTFTTLYSNIKRGVEGWRWYILISGAGFLPPTVPWKRCSVFCTAAAMSKTCDNVDRQNISAVIGLPKNREDGDGDKGMKNTAFPAT